MTEIYEKLGIKGEVIVEEINPVTQEVKSRQVCPNVICINGATSLAWVIASQGAGPSFNWMVLSTDTTAVLKPHTGISPLTAVSVGTITPTRAGPTVTWVYTFPSGGSAAIEKFGMQSTPNTPADGGLLWNEILFGATKDNLTNDLKVTYIATFAP